MLNISFKLSFTIIDCSTFRVHTYILTPVAKKEIVDSKTKMTMIHEAFFTIFALLVACLDIGILFYAWQVKSLSIGSVVALISLIDNAYTPIAIFNVLYAI